MVVWVGDNSVFVSCWRCGKEFTIQLKDRKDYMNWVNGELIQKAMPYLSAAERELLISKTCDNCFQQLFPPEDD